jgi:hypothetical protein
MGIGMKLHNAGIGPLHVEISQNKVVYGENKQ